MEDGYLLDNRQEPAGRRLRALGALFNPVSLNHMERMGIAAGWRCWEAGAGSPAVAEWMAERVGPSGRVLATDIDLSWIPATRSFEAIVHRLGAESPPETGFDLIHARLLLVHVPAREAALQDLVRALRPGGWLLVEEADPALQPLASLHEGPAAQLANRLKDGFRELMASRGVDLQFGRRLPGLLRGAGLEAVGASAFFPVSDPELVELEEATIEQIRPLLLQGGMAGPDEIEAHLENLRGGLVEVVTSPLISAWGRRPSPDHRR